MDTLFQHIVEIAFSAGFAVIGICMVRLLCKNAPKWIMVALWGLVGLRLLLPFSIESPVSVIPDVSLPVQQSVFRPENSDTIPPQSESDTGGHVIADDTAPSVDQGAEAIPTLPEKQPQKTLSASEVASTVWVIGVVGMLCYAVATYIGVWRRVRTATKDDSGVYRSEAVGSPFILGVFRPRIYVPYGMDGEHLRAVLAHEQTHIKRLDHIIKPLGFLLLSVYWFQPLLWVAYVLMCRDIELACDERVVKALSDDERRDYSMALLTSAVGRRRIAACPLAFGEVAVKERVKTVMSYKKPAFWIVIAAVVISAAAAVCLLTDPLSGTPYTTLDGAVLEFKLGGWTSQELEIPKGDDYIAQVKFDEIGKVYFTLEEADNRDMSVRVTLNREMYRNGKAVSEVTVPFDEEVVLYPTKDGEGVPLTLSIKMPSTSSDHYWYMNKEDDTMTLKRYANGDTVLYLYYKHFWLTDSGSSATDLYRDVIFNYQTSNNYYTEEEVDMVEKRAAEGYYEWNGDTLVLTEDGGLTRYVFRVEEDGTLTHLKGQLSRHEKAASPILANKLQLKHEYSLEVTKTELAHCYYTLRSGQGSFKLEGEADVSDMKIVTYEDGIVRLITEDSDNDRYCEQHELIDLENGKRLGTCFYGASDYRSGGTGYVPTACEQDGGVVVKAQYSSWCGTAPPANFLYKLEGLSSLRNGTVYAIVDGEDFVIEYTDDNGNTRVIAQRIKQSMNGEGEPLTRPLVAVTESITQGSSTQAQWKTEEGRLYYNQISAAYVWLDDKYVDITQAFEDGTLTFAQFETWLETAVNDGDAKKTVYNDKGDYRVDFTGADAYHTVFVERAADGVCEVTVGYKLLQFPLVG